MIGQLNGADVSVLAEAGGAHAGGLESRNVIRIYAVVAEVVRVNLGNTVNGLQPGTGDEPDGVEVVKGGRVVRTAGNGA